MRVPLRRRRARQLDLFRDRATAGRGGYRPGAGRKQKPGATSHRTRPRHVVHHPLHVTMRILAGAPSIATTRLVAIIRGAIADSHKPTFRIVEFNILSNHLHLICEAENEVRLARGVQGFAVRLVRRLNRALIRSGKLLADRYHARALTTPREVRLALRYVLLNRKHHAAEKRFWRGWIDPCSSAAWFTEWKDGVRSGVAWICELRALADPTARAESWLLRIGWKRAGPIEVDDRPARRDAADDASAWPR